MKLALTLVTIVTLWRLSEGIFFGAFNIQIFGVSKMSKPEVVDVLRKVLVRWDVVLIQEIRDASQTAIYQLFGNVSEEAGVPMDMYLGERLGRTSSKEQYAWFWKTSAVSMIHNLQYPESYDLFERPPTIVTFRRLGAGFPQDIAFAGIHAKPDDAVGEIDRLVDVYDEMRTQSQTDHWLIGGDFNADCSYVGSTQWGNIRLWTDNRFYWWIDHEADTTVAVSSCAYDRMVTTTTALLNSGSQPDVYYFDQVLGLDEQLTKDVSDHYPVELHL